MAELKERLGYTPEAPQKGVDIIDVRPDNEVTVPREVKTWMEKVEESAPPPTPVRDETTGQVVLKPVTSEDPKVTIPISKKNIL